MLMTACNSPPPSPPPPCRELSDLVKEVQPAARRPQARLSFAFVYPDRRGRNVMRQVRPCRRPACLPAAQRAHAVRQLLACVRGWHGAGSEARPRARPWCMPAHKALCTGAARQPRLAPSGWPWRARSLCWLTSCTHACLRVPCSSPRPGRTRTQPCARTPALPRSIDCCWAQSLQVGQVHSTRLGGDDSKSLKELNFQTGDFLSVAIY